ncbi:hypothetical protein TNCV_3969291 [Trichonephila clavipes]|nr:hypothetical protein TNCV_3969291 [Trichonephila clavipes]
MIRQNELRFTQKLEERVKTQTLKDIRLDDPGWMLIRNKKENSPCGIFDIESNPPGWFLNGSKARGGPSPSHDTFSRPALFLLVFTKT